MKTLILLIALFLVIVACTPKEAGEKIVGKTGLDTRLTGQVIDDVYNNEFCSSDTDCKVGRICINESCVARKNS